MVDKCGTHNVRVDGSFVVTGGGRGVGRAIVERLVGRGHAVVVVELDGSIVDWISTHAAQARLASVVGNASDVAVADEAADRAEAFGPLRGWVNNAAIFRDARLDTDGAPAVLDIVNLNLAPVVVGCATAVQRFRAAGTGGSIVNVSSHQAQRAVRGALPYATAKAAIEGLTRAAAVDHGGIGVRVNGVALGSIDTERYQSLLQAQGPQAAARTQEQMAGPAPSRPGRPRRRGRRHRRLSIV